VQLRANGCFRRKTHEDSRRERGQESRGRNKKAKGKPKTELPISDSELFAKWKTGKSSRKLAKIFNVSPTTILARLRNHNKRLYARIANSRTSPKSNGHRKELSAPVSGIYEQWKNGKSTRVLAKQYKVSRQTIRRRLKTYNEQEYKEISKKKIAAKIAEIAAEKEIPMSSFELSKEWKNGKSTRILADQCNVSRQTISRKLAKFNGKDYKDLAKRKIAIGRTKELPVSTAKVFQKWENGESPENLERLCRISYRQILEKLKAYDPNRYKRVAERRGLGSIRAKLYGARSLFELNVRRILEKHGIRAKETTLKFGKHHWRPDALLIDSKTIIEAMGLNFDWYWKRNKKKTKDYLRHGYRTIAVVPNEQICQKATKHLSKKVEIVRYDDFDNFVTTSLRKVPIRNAFCNNILLR
jgi:Mor family transcriptional regulator